MAAKLLKYKSFNDNYYIIIRLLSILREFVILSNRSKKYIFFNINDRSVLEVYVVF
jgi:hypothetical protein